MSMSKYTADWFDRAKEDLKVAKSLLEDQGFYNSICFHSHQAVEKYLKGFLAYHNLNVRKIHDLIVLVEECSLVEQSFLELKESIERLNDFYISTRYPGDIQILSEQDAKKAVDFADEVSKFVLKCIS